MELWSAANKDGLWTSVTVPVNVPVPALDQSEPITRSTVRSEKECRPLTPKAKPTGTELVTIKTSPNEPRFVVRIRTLFF